MYGRYALDRPRHVWHVLSMKREKSIGLLFVDICDKLTEIHETCIFLLEAYDVMSQDSGALNDVILSGGSLLTRDLNKKFSELEALLETAQKQLV
jgi:hypothetical protein